jgi:hypothetical protein
VRDADCVGTSQIEQLSLVRRGTGQKIVGSGEGQFSDERRQRKEWPENSGVRGGIVQGREAPAEGMART